MPDITYALNASLEALNGLGIQSDLERFTNRYWRLPSQPLRALDALILGPATPAASPADLATGLDWGKNRFGPILSVASPDAWLRLLRRPMRRKLREILMRYHGPKASAATRSRYRLTFVWDTTTLLKVCETLGLSSLFYSGMLKRTAQSIEVVLLYAMVGQDYLCLPMDFRLRKPDPKGPGRPCKTAIELAWEMVDNLHRSLLTYGLDLRGHFLVADAWFNDSNTLTRVANVGLIPIVRGKSSFVFEGTIRGQPFQGRICALLTQTTWHWNLTSRLTLLSVDGA